MNASLAWGDEGDGRAPITPPVELRHDWRVDGPVTLGLVASELTVILLRDDLQPGDCRWCDGSKPSDLNAVDDWFRTAFKRADGQPAKVIGDVLTYGVAPLATAGLLVLSAVADQREDGVLTDLLLTTEATVSALLLTDLLKPLILRQEPSVHAIDDDDERREARSHPAAIRSFPSSPTTAVFAMTAAAGSVGSMRGYRLAPLVWAAGIMVGVATAYARVAADKDYFTDTLGGAAVGMFVGAGVPLVFHRPRPAPASTLFGRVFERTRLTTAAVPRGRVVALGWEL